MVAAKPFLRWAGSKRKQIRTLAAYWSTQYERYIEPFAGSSCLFFAIQPQRAILADNNAHLIETYRWVRRTPHQIYENVAVLPRTRETYEELRAQDPKDLSGLDRAVRFIFLNRNCFNGIYRTNVLGRFNVPFATSGAGAFVTRDEFAESARLLRRAELLTCDFGTTLKHVSAGDFVYLDPPYAVAARRVFRHYGASLFDESGLLRLGKHLRRIEDRGAHFLVSYADCREARFLANGWHVRRIRVRRHVAGFAGARRAAYELLISNIAMPSSNDD